MKTILESKIIIDKIIRSRRRSVGLEISCKGELIVRAPLKISISSIENIVKKHKPWIIKKQKTALEKKDIVLEKSFIAGEDFWFLGEIYKLELVDYLPKPIVLKDRFFLLKEIQPQAKDLFINWYIAQAESIIKKRTLFYASLYELQIRQIKITKAKRQWGSCNPLGKIHFSFRLIMAPLNVIDYVIIHELSHLQHPNHSKRFWQLVEQRFPDHKNCRKWLRDNGKYFVF